MKVLAIEPYGARSHVAFLEGLAAASRHDWTLEVWPPRYWKWRMRTAALGVRDRVLEARPDLLFVSDFLNLAELRAVLPPGLRDLPAVVYFHENQLTYPLRTGERRDVHHGLTNVHAALAADHALFNSAYHRRAFVDATRDLLERSPDLDLAWVADELEARSSVLPLGSDLPAGEPRRLTRGEPPVLVWNHRWEYDKAPERFADLVDELASRGTDFRLVLLGERFREVPGALARLERDHSDRILHSGFAASRDDYLAWLDRGHLVVSTAWHEFFGLSTLEALRRGLLPILPDDLAYPELLPPEHRDAPWLYPRPEGADGVTAAADAVQAAAELLRANEAPDLTAPTSSLRWEHLAPRYDALLEAHGTDTNGPVPAP